MIMETRHTDFACVLLQKTVRVTERRSPIKETDSGQRAVISYKWLPADCSGKFECKRWAQTGCPLFP